MKKYLLIVFLFAGFNTIAQTNTFPSSGNVGVGTISPQGVLQIINNTQDANGNTLIIGPTSGANLRLGYNTGYSWMQSHGGLPLYINEKGNNVILNANGGNVGIGTTNPGTLLTIGNQSKLGVYVPFMISSNEVSNQMQLLFSQVGSSYHSIQSVNQGIAYTNLSLQPNGGNVGIGTTTPGAVLEVNGNIHVNGSTATELSVYNGGSIRGKLSMTGNEGDLSIYRSDGVSKNVYLSSYYNSYLGMSGNIGIGTTSPTEKLSVNGNIRSKKIIATQNGWADYVFNDGYRLRPLTEIESFIKENKHLPEVPTAKEVEKNGVDLGDNQALLLKKIEELTLYVIELKKENVSMQKEIESLKSKVK